MKIQNVHCREKKQTNICIWEQKYFISLFLCLCTYVTISAADVLYTNEFAIKILDGPETANELALQHGFINKGQIGSLKDYYLLEHHSIEKRSLSNSRKHHELLINHPAVLWAEQQHVKSRVKRDLERNQLMNSDPLYPDPLYPDQWFLHHGGDDGYDMNVIPAWADGYTGKGIVVSILDDGIQTNHPDLAQNYDKLASLDINGEDDDPMPQDNGDNNHGTRCAGEVAAVAFNNFCGVGVAYNASIGGVRMLDGSVTDATEATALSHNPNHIHIYSASWGPEDDGKKVDGPGPLAKFAFSEGIKKGRSGLGSIFVWASGNGGRLMDSCNCDGYTNSIYTLSISSATQRGTMPWYLEQCSSTLAATYSSGTASKDKNIVTVDMDNTYFSDLMHNRPTHPLSLCTKSHTGTSASAPIAAGICALALEANPLLTWRDMQYLVLMTSRPEPLKNEEGWIKNGVGRYVSTKFGYGLMDASAMVILAKKWRAVPEQRICESLTDLLDRIISPVGGNHIEATINTTGCKGTGNAIVYLEHVQVRVTLHFKPRGNLKIILVSPTGTNSTVLMPRKYDIEEGSFNNWPFMSVHFWGEKAEGMWKLIIINSGTNPTRQAGKLVQWSIVLYGTEIWPVDLIEEKRTEHRSPRLRILGQQNTEILTDSDRTLNNCPGENPFRIQIEKFWNCVDKCPVGYYADIRSFSCNLCAKSCYSCFGPSYDNCLTCDNKLYLSKNTCGKSCQDGYYAAAEKKECLPCSQNCSACELNHNNCVSCKSHYFHYETRCVATCPPKTFLHQSMCSNCYSLCSSCYGPSEHQCLDCLPGYVLYNGTCLHDCPSSFYASNDNTCLKCPATCKTCSGDKRCTSCLPSFTLKHGSCEFNYGEGCLGISTKNCYSCSKLCSFCNDSNNCLHCEKGFYLNNGQCLESCQNNYYLQSGECYQCPHMCQSCHSHSVCSSCKNNFVLYNNQCLQTCPPNYYQDGKHQCQTCYSPCFECSLIAVNCKSCIEGFLLFNNTCLKSCPDGYFTFREISQCLPCYHLCKTCSGLGPFDCTSCYSNSSLLHQACLPCLDDEYFDDASKSCLQCHTKCGRCDGPSKFNCLSCQAPLRLDEVKRSCMPCCDVKPTNHKECCACSKDLDICVNSAEHPRSIDGIYFHGETYEVVIPMDHVVPIVISICVSAVVLFILLFGSLQAHSAGWCPFNNLRRRYEKVPNLSAHFGSEMETVSLTREDPDEDDEMYERA